MNEWIRTSRVANKSSFSSGEFSHPADWRPASGSLLGSPACVWRDRQHSQIKRKSVISVPGGGSCSKKEEMSQRTRVTHQKKRERTKPDCARYRSISFSVPILDCNRLWIETIILLFYDMLHSRLFSHKDEHCTAINIL